MDFDKIFLDAERSASYLKILVSGVSGSGKSASSLLMAYGLTKSKSWQKVLGVDTEDSLALYSNNERLGVGKFKIVKITPPYDPDKIGKVLGLAEQAGFEVVIIDSITHFWSEDGGVLDIHAKYGGKFADWQKANPKHKAMFDAIKKAKMHIICTSRKKTDYAMNTENGRTKIEKVGLKLDQRDSIEYEFTTAFDVDIKHLATTSKDRTGLFMDRTPFLITSKTGEELLSWSNG